jgi:glutamate/tyrosine decarboxylase-like PLP-dependent enzyme
MEAEVVRMTLNLFHGDDNACGTVGNFLVLFLALQ